MSRAYALRLLQAGREVYALGKAKEGVQQGNSYGAPCRYEETTWADDMKWGAAELYRATGERAFLEDAKRYARLAAADTWMGKEQTKHYQFYPFINLGHFRLYGLVDAGLRRTLAGYYREGIESCLRTSASNTYRIGVPFIWCSNNLAVALATRLVLYERMTGDRPSAPSPPRNATGSWGATAGASPCSRAPPPAATTRRTCSSSPTRCSSARCAACSRTAPSTAESSRASKASPSPNPTRSRLPGRTRRLPRRHQGLLDRRADHGRHGLGHSSVVFTSSGLA